MICPSCGTHNAADAAECCNCQAPLPQVATETGGQKRHGAFLISWLLLVPANVGAAMLYVHEPRQFYLNLLVVLFFFTPVYTIIGLRRRSLRILYAIPLLFLVMALDFGVDGFAYGQFRARVATVEAEHRNLAGALEDFR